MKAAIPIVSLMLLVAAAPAALADHDLFVVGFDAETTYGDPVTLTAELLEPDDDCRSWACPKEGRDIDFYVNDEYVGTDVTNEGGFAYLLIDAAQKWHAGEHEIRAQYDRDTYPPSAAVAVTTLTIHAETTVLTARDGYFEAALTDDDNDALVGFPVTFYKTTPLGDEEVCTAFTDATGTAACMDATGIGFTRLGAEPTEYRAVFHGTVDHLEAADTGLLA